MNNDNGKERKIIFEAELLHDKTIKVSLKSTFLPMLTLACKLLEMEIENMLIAQIMKKESIIHPVDLGQISKIRIDGFKL